MGWCVEHIGEENNVGQSNQNRDENKHEPLACMHCGRNLIDTGFGNLVFIAGRVREMPPRYLDVYWACKSPCDRMMQVTLGIDRQPTSYKDIGELMNPLEHKLWFTRISSLKSRARLSAAAGEKITELEDKLSWVAKIKPTEEHWARFRQLRMMDGL